MSSAIEISASVRFFVIAFAAAMLARAVLVSIVISNLGCTLSEYSNSADGYQIKAMASGWRGDLSAVRQESFFKALVGSRGMASPHLIRFFPAGPGTLALAELAGLPRGVAATLPFWLIAATYAGLVAVWTSNLNVGLLVGLLPPITLYAMSLPGSGWLEMFTMFGLLLVRRARFLAAGIALGLAAWARPEGLFLGLAFVVALCLGRRFREAAQLSGGALVSLCGGAAAVFARFQPLIAEIFAGAPGTHMSGPAFLDIPGHALWNAFVSNPAPVWKMVYVGAHLAVAIVSLMILSRRAFRAQEAEERTELIALVFWVALHLGLVLSLGGSHGFDELPRYLALCAPAIVVAFVPWLTKARWWVALVCLASLGIALIPAIKNARPECGGSVAVVAGVFDRPGFTDGGAD